MRILVYEHLCATTLEEQDPFLAPLWREGRAMLLAVAEDLACLPETSVAVVLAAGSSLELPKGVEGIPHSRWLEEAQQSTDGVLLIAPETDGILTGLAEKLESLGVHLLGPSGSSIARFSPKENFIHLARKLGLAIPATIVVDDTRTASALPTGEIEHDEAEGDRASVMLKPADGAGCLATHVVPRDQWKTALEEMRSRFPGRRWLVQSYCPGIPASVAILAFPGREPIILPAALQRILSSPDPAGQGSWLTYEGGELPLDEPLNRRAQQLVEPLLRACPELRGYLGIDLILGPDRDVLIEVNPRLTTSYLGYRRYHAQETMARGLLGQLDALPPFASISAPIRYQP